MGPESAVLLPVQGLERVGDECSVTRRGGRHGAGRRGGKDLQLLGADVAAQCLQRGIVDEILVFNLPVLFGDGIHISSTDLKWNGLEPIRCWRSGDGVIYRYSVLPSSDQTLG